MGSVLGVTAAVLQIAGYLVYISNFLQKSIRPNAASYVMFAYGTAFVAFLAWENGAVWQELLLLCACAVMSIGVALLCLRKNATERVDRFEMTVFSVDLWLTIAYAALVFSTVDKLSYAALFLILGNITTVTSFLPILRSTWRTPGRELPMPWIIWSAAYLALFAATLQTTGWSQPVLLLYPAANFLLHIGVLVSSLRKSFGGIDFRNGSGSHLYHGPSPIAGTGVFAGRDYEAGETVWTMTGPVYRNSRTGHDPDFVGLAPGLWMDPDRPLNKLNHSCDPSAFFGAKRQLIALRAIARGEEVTFDYSTTELDPEWSMECSCHAKGCRLGLQAIHISFAGHETPPPASPLMQFFWRKWRKVPSIEPVFRHFSKPPADLPVYAPRRPLPARADRKRRRVADEVKTA